MRRGNISKGETTMTIDGYTFTIPDSPPGAAVLLRSDGPGSRPKYAVVRIRGDRPPTLLVTTFERERAAVALIRARGLEVLACRMMPAERAELCDLIDAVPKQDDQDLYAQDVLAAADAWATAKYGQSLRTMADELGAGALMSEALEGKAGRPC